MADHEFYGTVSGSTATESDHFTIKQQVDSLISEAKDLSNATGSLTTAQVSDFTTAVNSIVESVVDAEGAVEALDTLRELAEALGNDPNFSATITGMINGLESRIDALEADTGSNAYKEDIGDGVASSYTVTHNKGSQDVMVQVFRKSDNQLVFPVIKAPTTNTVTVDFTSFVPGVSSFRVIVNPL